MGRSRICLKSIAPALARTVSRTMERELTVLSAHTAVVFCYNYSLFFSFFFSFIHARFQFRQHFQNICSDAFVQNASNSLKKRKMLFESFKGHITGNYFL